jgi:hypothetical protein
MNAPQKRSPGCGGRGFYVRRLRQRVAGKSEKKRPPLAVTVICPALEEPSSENGAEHSKDTDAEYCVENRARI